MGDPIQVSVTITNSGSKNDVKPYVGCGADESYFHSEEFGTDPGFVVSNRATMTAFLPSDACEPMLYGPEWSTGTKCNAFCRNVCLRMFHITSGFGSATKLVLTKGDISQTFNLEWEKFRLVIPPGSYDVRFLDAADAEVFATSSPSISSFQAPRCTDYADVSSFLFTTAQPTPAPTAGPTALTTDIPTLAVTPLPTHGTPAVDLSYGKPASQICNYGSGYRAGNGVDGVTRNKRRFITHTCKTSNAWWRVDLGGPKEIDHVVIWNRPDCCQSRLSNFYVKFLDEDMDLVKQLYHPGGLGLVKTLYLSDYLEEEEEGNTVVTARYVQLELTASRDVMSVLEVKVMGWNL